MRTLSVVIPVFNEQENVPLVFDDVTQALERLEGWTWEVIWVDDGSTDGTPRALRALPARDPRHHVIRFRRNFGQTAALAAGFEHATGSAIVTLDGDLQNDPNDIPKLIAKLDDGYDIVNGWRRHRRDALLRRIVPSRFANWLISRVTGVRLHDYGCTLKVYRAGIARNLSLHGDLHRFIPALASWYGVDVAEVEVNHRPRLHGKSKYGIGRTLRVLVDLMTVKFLLEYEGRPSHLFGLVGIALSTAGALIMVYLGAERVFKGVALADRPVLLLAIMLAVLGLQFIGIGLIAELIMRAHREESGHQPYAIREIIWDDEGAVDSDAPAQRESRVGRTISRRLGPPEQIDDPADRAGGKH